MICNENRYVCCKMMIIICRAGRAPIFRKLANMSMKSMTMYYRRTSVVTTLTVRKKRRWTQQRKLTTDNKLLLNALNHRWEIMVTARASPHILQRTDKVQDWLPHSSVIPRKEAVEVKSDGENKNENPRSTQWIVQKLRFHQKKGAH